MGVRLENKYDEPKMFLRHFLISYNLHMASNADIIIPFLENSFVNEFARKRIARRH
jgi:hypothetical protein